MWYLKHSRRNKKVKMESYKFLINLLFTIISRARLMYNKISLTTINGGQVTEKNRVILIVRKKIQEVLIQLFLHPISTTQLKWSKNNHTLKRKWPKYFQRSNEHHIDPKCKSYLMILHNKDRWYKWRKKS